MATAQQTYDSGTTDLQTLINQGFQITELKAITTNDNPAFKLLDFINASVSASDLRTAGFTLSEFRALKVGIIQDNLPNEKPLIIGNHIRGITEDIGQDTNTTLSWQQLGINNDGTIVVSGSDTWYRVNSSTGVIETGMIIAFEYKLWTQNDINSLWHDNDDGTNNYFPFSSDTNMKYDEWFDQGTSNIGDTIDGPSITEFSGELDNVPVTTNGTGTGLQLRIEAGPCGTTYTITSLSTTKYSSGDTITISKDNYTSNIYIGDTLDGPTLDSSLSTTFENIPFTSNGSGTGLQLRIEVGPCGTTYEITTSPTTTYSAGDTITISKDDLTYTYKGETRYPTDVDVVITLASDLKGPNDIVITLTTDIGDLRKRIVHTATIPVAGN